MYNIFKWLTALMLHLFLYLKNQEYIYLIWKRLTSFLKIKIKYAYYGKYWQAERRKHLPKKKSWHFGFLFFPVSFPMHVFCIVMISLTIFFPLDIFHLHGVMLLVLQLLYNKWVFLMEYGWNRACTVIVAEGNPCSLVLELMDRVSLFTPNPEAHTEYYQALF